MGMPVIVGSDVTRNQSVTDMVQSVALEQTALSHILNAEGEKIQRVVADKEITTDQLLAANKSVESMVNSITKLEIILQSKLALFDSCLTDKDPEAPQEEKVQERPAQAQKADDSAPADNAQADDAAAPDDASADDAATPDDTQA